MKLFIMQRFRTTIKTVDAVMIAPGATRTERILGYGAGVFGIIFATVVCVLGEASSFATIVMAVVGFDLFGGVVVNATPSCSRRFHESRRSRWSAFGFFAGHVHMLVLAAALPEMPWVTAITSYVGILLAAVATTFTTGVYRCPTAFMLTSFLIAICTILQPLSMTVAWVNPVLVVKLLLSHLLPHSGDH